MNFKQCAEIQACFSSYLDGAISGHEMLEISRHIEGAENSAGERAEGCKDCAREFAAWRLTQNTLGALGPAKAPADLSLRLRIAISHERARRDSRWLDRLSLAWDNAVGPRLVQVSAGLAGSVVLGSIVLLLGVVAAPQPVSELVTTNPANTTGLSAPAAPVNGDRYPASSPGATNSR